MRVANYTSNELVNEWWPIFKENQLNMLYITVAVLAYTAHQHELWIETMFLWVKIFHLCFIIENSWKISCSIRSNVTGCIIVSNKRHHLDMYFREFSHHSRLFILIIASWVGISPICPCLLLKLVSENSWNILHWLGIRYYWWRTKIYYHAN